MSMTLHEDTRVYLLERDIEKLKAENAAIRKELEALSASMLEFTDRFLDVIKILKGQ